MAERNMAEIKSSLLKAISEHLDTLEQQSSAAAPTPARLPRDLYSKNEPGDHYSKNTRLMSGAVVLPADLMDRLDS